MPKAKTPRLRSVGTDQWEIAFDTPDAKGVIAIKQKEYGLEIRVDNHPACRIYLNLPANDIGYPQVVLCDAGGGLNVALATLFGGYQTQLTLGKDVQVVGLSNQLPVYGRWKTP